MGAANEAYVRKSPCGGAKLLNAADAASTELGGTNPAPFANEMLFAELSIILIRAQSSSGYLLAFEIE
jgi:hypothetical protein